MGQAFAKPLLNKLFFMGLEGVREEKLYSCNTHSSLNLLEIIQTYRKGVTFLI